MARTLCGAALKALKKAHAAYLRSEYTGYFENIKLAKSAVSAIQALGAETDCSRGILLASLKAELMLIDMLQKLNKPREAMELCQAAETHMLLLPSQVISGEAPMIPDCNDILEFFGCTDAEMAEVIDRLTALYSRLTDGGGGGVAEIYKAQLASRKGSPEESVSWARLALQRMRGDVWIAPIARRLIGDSDEDDHYFTETV